MSPSHRAADERFMRLALAEARKGLGRTSPNPLVGAVLVKGGRVVARGHHARAGGPHAEIVALRAAGARARGADLYTTLEPCDHQGRTPPCSVALVEAGVARVVAGSRDPNPLVDGRGLARLRRAGVAVVAGLLREECDALNAPWLTFMTAGRPYVTLKLAATLDGRVATASGDSRWVTGPEARAWVHRLRDQVDAVLVGRGTALADDPRLTARLPGGGGRDPLRVVLDTGLSLPPRLRLFRQRSKAKTLVLHAARREKDLGPGVELVRCQRGRGGLDLADALGRLAARGVVHLLVEGGGAVAGSLLAAGLVDRLALFLAPRILGEGRGWSPAVAPRRMAEALRLEGVAVERVGEDLLVTGAPALARPGRRV
ncbi:MAG TPA: bifunctional diaminohydroxyphosphoribosylaminopyrimidine deaminase/5-amino-6-(5-phosphoribosylamino)uracil reductase RibD [Anaeromyxobacteraceae bacterium]|nr:bifunctional diaminohydroxyphosphoribosylaminopyrimidine deaminase/5-amino-6-(5-phosphoribosylamino)uracil reductase RibD [Anaeromyxobacteraceae bacterium]